MTGAKQRRGGSLGFIVGVGVGIPATVFALSNLEATTVEFLGWQAEVPLWTVIGLSIAAGALLGAAGLLTWQARRRHGRNKAAKQAARAPQEGAKDAGGSTALEPPDRPEPDVGGRTPSADSR